MAHLAQAHAQVVHHARVGRVQAAAAQRLVHAPGQQLAVQQAALALLGQGAVLLGHAQVARGLVPRLLRAALVDLLQDALGVGVLNGDVLAVVPVLQRSHVFHVDVLGFFHFPFART